MLPLHDVSDENALVNEDVGLHGDEFLTHRRSVGTTFSHPAQGVVHETVVEDQRDQLHDKRV